MDFEPYEGALLDEVGEIRSFQDLVVWQRSIELTSAVYALTRAFPRDEVFGLTNHLRRASVSVASNIAEGKISAHGAWLTVRSANATHHREKTAPRQRRDTIRMR